MRDFERNLFPNDEMAPGVERETQGAVPEKDPREFDFLLRFERLEDADWFFNRSLTRLPRALTFGTFMVDDKPAVGILLASEPLRGVEDFFAELGVVGALRPELARAAKNPEVQQESTDDKDRFYLAENATLWVRDGERLVAGPGAEDKVPALGRMAGEMLTSERLIRAHHGAMQDAADAAFDTLWTGRGPVQLNP